MIGAGKESRTLFAGVDPGVTGAIAILDAGGSILLLDDLPTIASGKGGAKVSLIINPAGLSEIVRPFADRIKLAALEKVSAMPGQGVSSTFSLGDSFGCLRGVISALGMPLTIPSPSSWKRVFGLDSDKERSRARAVQLYPSADLHRKKDHNRAEALLLALYALQTHQFHT